VVATPIGNLGDISLRALEVLRGADAIVAEDTRVTAKLLAAHGISRPLLTYNDHNAARERPKLLARLAGGDALALVSDAGTPLISDPGHKLVREARGTGIEVYAVPGASAVMAGLSIAGLPTNRFFFAGFLPAKSGERRSALQDLKSIPATLVFFESPQRIKDTLDDMAEFLGAREAAVGRELTKMHEEVRRGTLADLAAHYAAAPAPKGEITLVVGPPEAAAPADQRKVDILLALALPHMPVKDASALVAEATGHSRRDIYARALVLKDKDAKRS
jgi:16S rRNA (cytidine1402-2'-O)-methyltransferase